MSSDPEVAVADIASGAVLERTGYTAADNLPLTWSSHTNADLVEELSMIDLRVHDKLGSGVEVGEELVQSATRVAQSAAAPFDFQLVIEQHVEPVVAATEYTAGIMSGTWLVYDRAKNTVPCGAHLSAVSSDSVSYRASGLFKEDPRTKVGGDLMKNLMSGAPAKLVAMGPKR